MQGPGHCTACHTPKSFLGGDKRSQYLRGSEIQGWFAPDLTNNDTTGLGRWSAQDVTAYLKTGHNRVSAATGPMAEEITHSSSHMTDSDLAAIATYLKSLGTRTDHSTAVAASDTAMVAGGAIYRDQCSACHALDGHGVPQLFPSLADSAVVRSSDPSTLIRLVLRGARSVATAAEPTSPGHALVRLAARRCPGCRSRDLYSQCVAADGAGRVRRRCAPRAIKPARTNGLGPLRGSRG